MQGVNSSDVVGQRSGQLSSHLQAVFLSLPSLSSTVSIILAIAPFSLRYLIISSISVSFGFQPHSRNMSY